MKTAVRTQSRGLILSDICSTIADTRHRRALSPTVDPSSTWERYFAGCGGDRPIAGTVTALRAFHDAGYDIHLVSNRPTSVWRETQDWIARHNIPCDALKLRDRPLGNGAVHKVDYIRELHRQGHQVVLFFEDDPEAAFVIEAFGVPVLCVNPRYKGRR